VGQGALLLGGWLVRSGWHSDDTGQLTIEITIPFNASARVVLPNARMGEISMNGHSLEKVEQVGNSVELTVDTGCYRFEYPLRKAEEQSMVKEMYGNSL
jgi:hypothetical protein